MGYFFSWIPLSKSAAESGLNVSEILIIVAGLILTLGAIGEYLEDHKKLPSWLEWPKLVFIVMVVAGLVGEFIGDAGVFIFSGSLQTISDKELTQTEGEARDANHRAGLAFNQATEAIKRGSPRILDPSKFVSRLDGKPKRTVQLLYPPNDTEAYLFAEQIMEAVRQSGWKASKPVPIPATGGNILVPNAPGQIRYGTLASVGLTFVGKNVASMSVDDRNAFHALELAVTLSLAFEPPAVAFAERDDPAVPDGRFIIVVGQKM